MKNQKLFNEYGNIGLYLFLFFLFLCLFCSIAYYSIYTDIIPHAIIAKENYLADRMFSGNFLLYFLINVLSVFSSSTAVCAFVNCALLSLATIFKFFIVKKDLVNFYDYKKIIGIVSFSLLFVYIIPFLFFKDNNFYLNYWVPNCWHNSTIILSIPFSIISYVCTIRLFSVYSPKTFSYLCISTLIGVLIKPSYFFIFSVAYSFIAIWFIKGNKLKLMFPILLGGLATIYVFLTTYVDAADGSSVGVDFNRLLDFNMWAGNFLYILSSLLLPIVFFVTHVNLCMRDKEFYFVTFQFIIAIVISIVCYENGPRDWNGNFSWQIIPAMWFLYYYIIKKELTFLSINGYLTLKVKDKIVMLVYIFCFLSGIAYIGKIFLSRLYT